MAFGQYKGRCVGRLMRFLYAYDNRSDEAIFHGHEYQEKYGAMVTLSGRPYANYTWDGDTDVPTFCFLGDFGWLNKVQTRIKAELLATDKLRAELFPEPASQSHPGQMGGAFPSL